VPGRGRRLVIIAVQGGVKAEFDAGLVLRRRLTITGSTLRVRPVAFKGAIAQALRQRVWPWLEAGRVKPIVHAQFAALEPAAGLPSGAARARADAGRPARRQDRFDLEG
jgi:NADPH2:quinone reductase